MQKAVALWLMAISLAGCSQSYSFDPAVADPPADLTHPASNFPFAIPVGSGAINAMMYTASGDRPHPTVLLLHAVPTSVVDAMARGDILQVVVFAPFFGIAVASLGVKGKPVFNVLEAD